MLVQSLWIALGLLVLSAALWKFTLEKSRLRTAAGFLIIFAAVSVSALLPPSWHPDQSLVNGVAVAFVQFAGLQVSAVIVFDLLLRKARVPKFAGEIVIVAGYVAIIFNLLYKVGINVTGIFATSAVATAVVGLALQDMLSNIAGGVALELEGGIRVGDYIRVGDAAGWVQHIRLRHTALTTSDGDTLILPNSHLTRSAVAICGHSHRRFIPVTMSYTINPQEVMDAIQFALRASSLPGVAAVPPPTCVLQELNPSCLKFAAVVWLDRPGHEQEAISAINVRLYFALQRAGIPASEITYLLEMKAGGGVESQSLNPVDVLRRTPILRLLSDPDLYELGACLRNLSFAPGEQIIRQGDSGSSMYFVVAGEVSILYRSPDGLERQISIIEGGDFFGEASLLTGETRSASAVAESRVVCYRLDKEDLERVLARRPELAEDMSVVMAHRQIELGLARERLDAETATQREAESQTQFLFRIRRFFGLNGA